MYDNVNMIKSIVLFHMKSLMVAQPKLRYTLSPKNLEKELLLPVGWGVGPAVGTHVPAYKLPYGDKYSKVSLKPLAARWYVECHPMCFFSFISMNRNAK